MADSIYTFDPVPANNTALDSIPYGPNQLYHNQIDNWFRALGSKLAQFVDHLGAVNTVAGTGDAVTVTLASGITAYATGQFFRFIAGAANTGAATMNVNSIGAKAIRKISGGTDVALSAGDIAAGETYLVRYSASANSAAGAWIIVGAAAVAAATTSAAGIVELATNAETLAGTDTSRAVTPSTLYFPTGHLYGLTLSNNGSDATNDIDIAAGTARDGSDTANMILASVLTKQLDAAWAVGTNAGMRATGVAIANTTYHIFLIRRPDTGVVDVAADTSVTGANIAANTNVAYTQVRRIGSIVRASAAIRLFNQYGDRFIFKAGPNTASTFGTSRTLVTTGAPPNTVGIFRVYVYNSASTVLAIVQSTAETDVAPGSSNMSLSSEVANIGTAGSFEIDVDGSSQIALRANAASSNYNVYTQGFIDTRGRV